MQIPNQRIPSNNVSRKYPKFAKTAKVSAHESITKTFSIILHDINGYIKDYDESIKLILIPAKEKDTDLSAKYEKMFDKITYLIKT